MKCRTCQFHYYYDFKLTNPKKWSERDISECHAMPPILLPTGRFGWPDVNLNSFCGMYSVKTGEEDAKKGIQEET